MPETNTPHVRWGRELAELAEMGLTDIALNVQVLNETRGNVLAVVDRYFS